MQDRTLSSIEVEQSVQVVVPKGGEVSGGQARRFRGQVDALADATRALRAAGWNRHAAGPSPAVDATGPTTQPGEPR